MYTLISSIKPYLIIIFNQGSIQYYAEHSQPQGLRYLWYVKEGQLGSTLEDISPRCNKARATTGGVPTEPFNEDWLKSIEPKSLRDKYIEAAKIYEEVPPTLKVDTHAEATLLFDTIVDNDVDDIEIDVEEDERED